MALCDILYKCLRNTLTYLLTYLLTYMASTCLPPNLCFPAASALLPPKYGTHSLLAFAVVLHHIHCIVFLKPIVLIRPSVPPSGSHKCLRFGLLAETLKDFIYLLIYSLTYLLIYMFYSHCCCTAA